MTAGTGHFSTLAWGPGTPYAVVALEGERDLPPIRARDIDLDERHGSVSLPDYTAPTVITLTLGLAGTEHGYVGLPGSLEQLCADVRDATPPQAGVLPLIYRDGFRFRWAKVRKRAVPQDTQALWRLGQAIIEFYCPDPREYETFQSSTQIGLPSSGGGIGFPTGFPIDFGPGGAGGDALITNLGNVPTPLLLRINGPVTNPIIGVGGRILSLQTTIAAGEWYDINTEARTVLLNGTGSRRSTVLPGSAWPMLNPGTSTLQFRASSAYDPSTYLLARYRGAWL